MAVIDPTVTYTSERDAVIVTWAGLANGDTGKPWGHSQYGDRSVQIEGAAFGGGTLTMQGSNDATNYQSVTDPQGNAIAKTAAALETISENTRLLRPSLAGGAAGAVTVTLYARRNR